MVLINVLFNLPSRMPITFYWPALVSVKNIFDFNVYSGSSVQFLFIKFSVSASNFQRYNLKYFESLHRIRAICQNKMRMGSFGLTSPENVMDRALLINYYFHPSPACAPHDPIIIYWMIIFQVHIWFFWKMLKYWLHYLSKLKRVTYTSTATPNFSVRQIWKLAINHEHKS